MSDNQFTSDMKAFVVKVIKQRLLIIAVKSKTPSPNAEHHRYMCEVLGNNLNLIYADKSAARWFKQNAAAINNLIIKREKKCTACKQEKELRDLLSRANSILIPELS